MKDKDNQIIYYKHYIIKKFKRKIITDRNNKVEFTTWEELPERKRKNINCEMTYRRGEQRGRYKYKWFMWAKWDHEYEYKFEKQLIRTYDDGKTE